MRGPGSFVAGECWSCVVGRCVIRSLVPVAGYDRPMAEADDAEVAARHVAEEFVEGFNARDDQRHRDLMNFPSVILVRGECKIWHRPEDYSVPWDKLASSEGWHRSTLDSAEVVQAGEDKVHLLVAFSRFDRDDVKYSTRQGLWVITEVDGHWGIQCRSSFPP